jgi:uncharacterized protein YfeS
MKYLIMTLLFFTVQSHAQDEMSPACQVVLERDYVSVSPVQDETTEILKAALKYTRKILDLKFESHAFFTNNRELYGEFKRLETLKLDIEERRQQAIARKVEKERDSNQLLLGLSVLDPKVAQKISNTLLRERANELQRQNNLIYSYKLQWDRHSRDYYDVVGQWAPYQHILKELTNLEDSLQLTLKRLAEINQTAGVILTDVRQSLSTEWRQQDAEEICQFIDQKLLKIAEQAR